MEKGMYMVLIVAVVAVVSLVFLTLNAGNVGTLAFSNADLAGMATEGAGLSTKDAGGTQTAQSDDEAEIIACYNGCIKYVRYACYNPCTDRNNECLTSVQGANKGNPSGRFKTSSGFGTNNAIVACRNAYASCLGRCTTYLNTCADNC